MLTERHDHESATHNRHEEEAPRDHGLSRARRLVIVGGFLPRRCGISTFSSHLYDALREANPDDDVRVVVFDDRPEGYDYPDAVWAHFHQDDEASYAQAAERINDWCPDAVLLQHEYGIYGGPAGMMLLRLLDRLQVPVVTTLHTVLEDPDPQQFEAMSNVVRSSARVVVMNNRARDTMTRVYNVPRDRIAVVPHGVPRVRFRPIDPGEPRQRKVRMITFGLLSRGKGLEYAIRALPTVVAHYPDVDYTILGSTHPHVIDAEGEAYRNELAALAKELDVADHVHFENRFVPEAELVRWLEESDIYVTPYLGKSQSSSGTLAYAVGAGLAVLSTPYDCARDLLAGNRGVLVPFRDPEALASALIGLLEDREALRRLQERAFAFGRTLHWTGMARAYRALVDDAGAGIRPAASLWDEPWRRVMVGDPAVRLDHLVRMTDDMGLVQHARLRSPDVRQRYATDDNARALLLTSLARGAAGGPSDPLVEHIHRVYRRFLADAFDHDRGRFRNIYHGTRGWEGDLPSEDCHGRAVWALGVAANHAVTPGERQEIDDLLRPALLIVDAFRSPRALAFVILGLIEAGSDGPDGAFVRLRVRTMARRLQTSLRNTRSPDWLWFEPVLSYDNARLPHALLAAGRFLQDDSMQSDALAALDWLMAVQRPEGQHFVPLGSNGFWRRGGLRARFDQQPVEAWATIDAALAAYAATGQDRWLQEAQVAYDWFLGTNDLGAPMVDDQSGGCRDGLHPDRPNQNQGAESTLAWLLSTWAMRSIRRPDDTELATAPRPLHRQIGAPRQIKEARTSGRTRIPAQSTT